jgi:hypothetical protein
MYLSITTRPDITYATSVLASHNPGEQHWEGVKYVMAFLNGLVIEVSSMERSLQIKLQSTPTVIMQGMQHRERVGQGLWQ